MEGVLLVSMIFLLCFLIMACRLSVLFLLKILLYRWFFGKCFRKVQKLSAYVCLYVYAVRWIKPNNVSLSVLAAILWGACDLLVSCVRCWLIFRCVRFA